MLRWWLIPRNKYFNIYLHHFLRRDEDRALHDHPWWSISFIFEGSYFEHTELETAELHGPDATGHCFAYPIVLPVVTQRDAGAVAWRRATSRHRISLPIETPDKDHRVCRHGGDDELCDCGRKWHRDCVPVTREVPCWTIFITGPKVREWGFWCGQRFVPWRIFTGSDHNVTGVGSIGAGCGED